MALPKWLSFDFFKSERQKELEREAEELKETKEALRQEIEDLRKELIAKEENKEVLPVATVATVKDKLFLSLHFDGSKLTVVSADGALLIKSDATKDDIKAVKDAQNEDELKEVFYSHEKKKEIVAEEQRKELEKTEPEQIKKFAEEVRKEEAVAVRDGFHFLTETGEFDVEDNVVYLKGIRRSLPKVLINKFSKIVARVKKENDASVEDKGFTRILQDALNEDLEFLAHKRFTYWCFLAPYPQVLDKLYPFLEAHGLKLTKEGFFLAIRNVVTVAGTKNDYADVVTNAFTKIKTVWKKKPSNFELWKKDEEFILNDLKKPKSLEGATLVGNIQELNDNIKDNDEVRYTDDYSKSFDIRLNKWVKVDPTTIEWASANCVGTGGLHFSLNSTGLMGDKSLLIAINPMHITSIGTYKGTSWAYFPFMATELGEARKLLLDQSFESFNLDFGKFSEEFQSIEEAAKEGFKEHNKVERFDLPKEELPKNVLNEKEIEFVTKSLEEMKNELSTRVVEV